MNFNRGKRLASDRENNLRELSAATRQISVESRDMSMMAQRYLLHLASLGLLLRDVLLDGIIEDRLDAKLSQSVQNGSDLHLIFASDEMTVERCLHELGEESLAEQHLGQFHKLFAMKSSGGQKRVANESSKF